MLDTTAVEKNPMITITSPYASFFLKNINGFSVELGARHNIHSKYGNNFTWSFNPSYWLGKNAKLFFNYSTGFKAPMLNQLYGQYGANPDLKPEKSETLEAGMQFVSSNKNFDMRAVLFTRAIDDVIIYNSQFQYVNFNQQSDYGFEFEPGYHLNKLSLNAFYAFAEGKVKTKTTAGTDTTYNNLIRRPKNSFGVTVGYQFTLNFFASVGLKTFGQRNDQYYDASFALQSIVLQSYQLLDVYAEYKFKNRFRFFAHGKNLLNQDYMEVAGYNTLKANINIGMIASF
jgi:vitamin B12 transporter